MSRSVLVTGGNRGIGLAIARRFAAAGDAVTVTSRSGAEIDGLTVARCDVRDVAAVDEAFKLAEAAHGPVEVVVANAGTTADQLLALMSENAFTSVVDTNLTGAYRVARGGSFFIDSFDLRSYARSAAWPSFQSHRMIGFRVAREP